MTRVKITTLPQLTTAVAGILGAAPTTLDTLQEVDTAIGNDPNFAATIAGQMATNANAASNAQTTADAALALARQLASAATPVSPGTYLLSGGSVAFLGTRSYGVAPATYVINGTQYVSSQGTVTIGAADATNPRFDAIVLDTSGNPAIIAGVASATPVTPDVDPLLYLVLQYVRIDAAASAIAVAITDIYRENTEWTSSVSGAGMNAASTASPHAGTKDIEATNVANGNYVRLTAPAPVSLSGQRQLVASFQPKAAFPNSKTLQVTWYLSGVKVGQSVTIQNGAFGLVQTNLTYQQLVIPITLFQIGSASLVDMIEIKVVGGGSSMTGWHIDDMFLEGASTAVALPTITALQTEVDALRIRTLTFTIDGGGLAITTGIKGDLPLDFAGKIIGWTLLGDQAGSIVIDLWRDTYANYPPTIADTITASAKPTLASASKASGTTGTWNASFNAGDTIRVNVDSVAVLTRATLGLKVQVA